MFAIIPTEVTYVVQNDQGLGPTALLVAHGEKEATPRNGGDKLLNEKSQESAADKGQVEVVDQEERPQLEGLAVAHQLPATKDYNVVNDDEDTRLLEG